MRVGVLVLRVMVIDLHSFGELWFTTQWITTCHLSKVNNLRCVLLAR